MKVTETTAEQTDQKSSDILVFVSGKTVNLKLIGEDFFMISISKIMVPL
jgi:hypothetical protein